MSEVLSIFLQLKCHWLACPYGYYLQTDSRLRGTSRYVTNHETDSEGSSL